MSLSEQVDTSTPTGKMVFTVLVAVEELERSLIAERVRAGLRNARAKEKCLGKTADGRECRQDCHAASTGAFVARYYVGNGDQQVDGPAIALWLAQKRLSLLKNRKLK